MEEQRAHEEVHALHVADFLILDRVSVERAFKPPLALQTILEELASRKGAVEVTLNLTLSFLLALLAEDVVVSE